MLVDTHAHINFNAYKKDADEVIRRSLDSNTWIINVGSQYSTSKKATEFTQKYKKGVYRFLSPWIIVSFNAMCTC